MRTSAAALLTRVSARAAPTGIAVVAALLLAWLGASSVWTQAASPGGVSTGLGLWLRADAGLTADTGSSADQWTDQSANAFVFADSDGNAGPDIVTGAGGGLFNFNPSLDFGGGGTRSLRHTTAATTALSAQQTIIGVYNKRANGQSALWLDNGAQDAGLDMVVYKPTGTSSFYYRGTSSPGIPLNETHIVGGGSTGTATADVLFDGRLVLNDAADSTGAAATTFAAGLALVGRANAVFTGNAPEFLVYTRKLTPVEFQRVSSYLAIKYGITMDQTTPLDYLASDASVVWNATAKATYKNNITGIGRDDASNLNQKQSRSANTANSGNLLTIGLGTVATDNASNANAFGADRDFLIWGDNGASVALNTSVTGTTPALTRMARVWTTEETGTVGSVLVRIPKAYLPGTNPSLVRSVDAAFDSGDTFVPLIANGSNYDVLVDLNDGEFFTFASTLAAPGGVASGLVAWQKADDGISSVSLWEDSSGSNNDAAQVTVASRPILRLGSADEGVNFNPAFDFDGTNDFFDFTNALGIGGTADSSSFFAFRGDVGSHGFLLGDAEAAANQFTLSWNSGPFTSGVGGGPATCNFSTTTSVGAGRPAIASAVRTSSNMRLELNSGGAASGSCATAFTSKPRRLAARHATATTNFFNGAIPEFIEYNRALTIAEARRVQSYLAIKYGVTLDQTTPTNYVDSSGSTIWNAASNATYDSNIGGIGRDDASGLSQRQSFSTNGAFAATTGWLTIGLGAIAADNVSNPNDFTADRSFLIWGQNNATTAQTIAIPSTTFTRLGRVWRVQETGSVGNVAVRHAASLLAGSQLSLVRSADPTFASGNTFYPLTVVGTQIEASSVDFTSGDYFTFASVLQAPGGVAGSSLWLRGDAGMSCATTGCAPTRWNDQSGVANHADTVVGTPSRVGLGVNFNPTLDFDAGDGMRGSSIMGTASYSNANAYVVSKTVTAGNSDFFEFGNVSTARIGVWQPSTDNIVYWDAGSNSAAGRLTAPSGTITTNAFELKTYNASTTANQTIASPVNTRQAIAKNGKVVTSDTTMAAFTGGNKPYSVGGLSLDFNNVATATSGAEELAEVIVFTSAITAAQQLQIHSYLALKYGVTLDQTPATNYVASNAAVIWNGTTNAIYNKNIAGIGRDDTSGLNQRQSQSINTASSGNFVTIGLGTIAADNASNPSTFGGDGSFLVWGDDAGSLAQTTAVTGGSLPAGVKRLTRVWKAQETGTVGGVLVRIPSAPLKGAQPVLIRSADATFDGGDTIVPLTLNGSTYEASTDFGAGDFFTFAALVGEPGGVAGAALWVKANDGVQANGTNHVQQWFDQSGSANTTTDLRASLPAHTNAIAPSSAILQVANAINFNPAVDFSGATGRSLKGNAVADWNAAALSVFGVALSEGAPGGGAGGIFDGLADWTANDGTSAGVGIHWNGAAFSLDGAGCNGGAATTSTVTGPVVLRGIYTTAGTATGGSIALNGVQEAAATACANYATTFFEVGGRTSGTATFDARVFNGKIAEVIVYRSNVAAANANKIESYLAIKYGVTLRQTPAAKNYFDSGNAVIWDATANAAYRNNIAGIGRDDLSTLDQRQSRSVNTANTGNLVTIGLGAIAADNVSNANTFAADKHFTIWGDDAGSLALSAAVPGTAGVRRMGRVWKVQETGAVGTVQVRVPACPCPARGPR